MKYLYEFINVFFVRGNLFNISDFLNYLILLIFVEHEVCLIIIILKLEILIFYAE